MTKNQFAKFRFAQTSNFKKSTCTKTKLQKFNMIKNLIAKIKYGETKVVKMKYD